MPDEELELQGVPKKTEQHFAKFQEKKEAGIYHLFTVGKLHVHISAKHHEKNMMKWYSYREISPQTWHPLWNEIAHDRYWPAYTQASTGFTSFHLFNLLQLSRCLPTVPRCKGITNQSWCPKSLGQNSPFDWFEWSNCLITGQSLLKLPLQLVVHWVQGGLTIYTPWRLSF